MRTTIITEVPIPVVITEAEVGPQGPQGPPGTGGGDDPLAARLDTTQFPLIYAGEAQPGSNEEEPVWRIWRVDVSTGSVKEWANGAATFINRWDQRTLLDYS